MDDNDNNNDDDRTDYFTPLCMRARGNKQSLPYKISARTNSIIYEDCMVWTKAKYGRPLSVWV